MASIDIQLTQSAYDRQNVAVLGNLFDGIERVGYAVASNYPTNSTWSQSGTNLVLHYADGATETYTGYLQDHPGASQGTAIASGYQFQLANGLVLNYSGILNLKYAIDGNSIAVDVGSNGWLLNGTGFATQLATSDPSYDATYGNTAIGVKGILSLSPDDSIAGTVSQFSLKSDKVLLSETVDGNFTVSGNLLTDGAGQTHSAVSGTLTGFHQAYADGSHVDMTDLLAQLAAPYAVDPTLLANASYFGCSDTINVDLPASLLGDYLVASGAGDDQITLKGGGGHLNASAGDGNDRITLLDGAHKVDGGAGLDTVVLASARADVQVVHNASDDSFQLTDKAGAVSTLTGVERLQFSDASVALDIDGSGGQAYRVYQAAFNRAPDLAGLGFWIDAMDNGASLSSVAQGFVASDEFKQAYGANPSHTDLVTRFYQNILHRAPEQAGLDYWVGVLDGNKAGVSDVLFNISESAENKAGLIGVIGNGFVYTPYHH